MDASWKIFETLHIPVHAVSSQELRKNIASVSRIQKSKHIHHMHAPSDA